MKKQLVRWLSALLALGAGAFFIVYAHRALAGRDLSALLGGGTLAATAALTLVYMLLTPSTAVAWTWLLRSMDQAVGYSRMIAILASTQFGKYLPGNIAHHIGRIALARAAGVRLPVALFSVAYEMLLVLVACAHVSALTLLWNHPEALSRWKVASYRTPLLVAVTVCAVLALLLAPRIALRLARARAEGRGDTGYSLPHLHLAPATVASAYGIYAINFCLIGCGLWLVAHALLPVGIPTPNIAFLIGAFASSWILGFIAPGAPAGLGIREAILSAWLSTTMPAADVVLLVIALRIATTIGDLLNFAWGSLMLLKLRSR
jgi:hypothetical protein